MYKLAPELYGLEAGAERQQRFRMAQQQVAAVFEQRINQCERLLGGFFVKVHEHIAAEDSVEAAGAGRLLKASRVRADQVRLFNLHGGAQVVACLSQTAFGAMKSVLPI